MILDEPSKEAEPVTAPLTAIFLAVSNAVAVSALPVRSPTNELADIEPFISTPDVV